MVNNPLTTPYFLGGGNPTVIHLLPRGFYFRVVVILPCVALRDLLFWTAGKSVVVVDVFRGHVFGIGVEGWMIWEQGTETTIFPMEAYVSKCLHATFCFSHGSKCLSPSFWRWNIFASFSKRPSLDSRKGFHVRIIFWRSANQVCFLPKQAKTLSSLSFYHITFIQIPDSPHVFGNSDLCLNLNLIFCLVSAFEINDIVLKTPDFKDFLDITSDNCHI